MNHKLNDQKIANRQKLIKLAWIFVIIGAGFAAVFGYLAYSISASEPEGSVATQIDLSRYVWVFVMIAFVISPVIKGLKRRKELKLQSKEASRELLDGFSPLNPLESSIANVLSGGWWTDEQFMMEFCSSQLLVIGKEEDDHKSFYLNMAGNIEGIAPFVAFTHRKRLDQAVCPDPFDTMQLTGAELLRFIRKNKTKTREKRGLVLYIGKQALIEESELNRMVSKLDHVLSKLAQRRKNLDDGLKANERMALARDGDYMLAMQSIPPGTHIRIGIPAVAPTYLSDMIDRLEKAWPDVNYAYLFLREIVAERKFYYVIGLDLAMPNNFMRVITDLSQYICQNEKPYEPHVDFIPIKPFCDDSEFCRLNVEPFYVKNQGTVPRPAGRG